MGSPAITPRGTSPRVSLPCTSGIPVRSRDSRNQRANCLGREDESAADNKRATLPAVATAIEKRVSNIDVAELARKSWRYPANLRPTK